MKNCSNSKYDRLCGKGVHVIRKYVTLIRIKSQNIFPNQLLSIPQIQMQTKWHIPFWESQDGKQNLNKYQA